MKPGAVFMNVGRGSTVNEPDLITALKNGMLSGAALDVFAQEPLPQDSELWSLPNVLIYPHTSCKSDVAVDNLLEIAAENILLFKKGQPLKYVCDKRIGY